jgi:hypothetical protein
MTREEIISKGIPVKSNCFETDREEQWYKVGLYEGATSNSWHKIENKLPPIDEDCLFIFFNGRKNVVGIGYMREDKSVRLEGEFSPILDIEEFDYWCEIPPFENK